MSVRSRMTMRATTERNVVTGYDIYGSPITALQEVYSNRDSVALHWGDHALTWGDHPLEWGGGTDGLLPCYVQASVERSITDDERLLIFTTYLLLVPKGADLLEEDVITQVDTRRGNIIFDSRLRLTTLVRRETHLEGVLEQYA